MYIMNIKDFSNHSINFIFLLQINNFMYKVHQKCECKSFLMKCADSC